MRIACLPIPLFAIAGALFYWRQLETQAESGVLVASLNALFCGSVFVQNLEADESCDEILRHIKLVRERGHEQFERRHRRKDGTLRRGWFSFPDAVGAGA